MTEPTPRPDEDLTEPEYVTFYSALPEEWLTPEDIAQMPQYGEPTHIPRSEIVDLGNGQRIRVHAGPARIVPVSDPATGDRRTVVIPGAPAELTDEAAEAEARLFYADVRFYQEHLPPQTIADYVAELEQAQHFRALADEATKALQGIKVSHPGDLSELGIPPEHRDTAAQEATRLLRERMGSIVDALFFGEESGARFKTAYARDVLAVAHTWALEDARAAVEALREENALTPEAATEEALWELAADLYPAGTYITRSLFTRFETTVPEMIRLAADVLKQIETEHPDELRSLIADAWQRYTETLPPPVKRTPPLSPAYDATGLGKVSSSKHATGVSRMFIDATVPGMPGYAETPDGSLYYAYDQFTYYLVHETAEAARAEVLALGDRHAALFDYLQALYATNARSVDDKIEPALNDMLKALGYAEHHKGGYRRQHRQKMREMLDSIARIRIDSGTVNVTETVTNPKTGRPKTMRVPRQLEADKVIEVGPYLTKTNRKTSDPTHVRIGMGWAIGMTLLTPGRLQYTLTNKHAPALAGQTIYASRLERYIRTLWRIRANKTGQGDGVEMRTLLAGARIPLPELARDRARFRTAVEDALWYLTYTRPPIMPPWRWRTEPPKIGTRGWWEAWLKAVAILPPPAAVRERLRKPEPAELPEPAA